MQPTAPQMNMSANKRRGLPLTCHSSSSHLIQSVGRKKSGRRGGSELGENARDFAFCGGNVGHAGPIVSLPYERGTRRSTLMEKKWQVRLPSQIPNMLQIKRSTTSFSGEIGKREGTESHQHSLKFGSQCLNVSSLDWVKTKRYCADIISNPMLRASETAVLRKTMAFAHHPNTCAMMNSSNSVSMTLRKGCSWGDQSCMTLSVVTLSGV